MMTLDTTQVVIAGSAVAGIVVTLLAAIFGMLVRITVKWTKLESTVEHLKSEIRNVDTDSQAELKSVRDDAREDRRATDERLRYLERREMAT